VFRIGVLSPAARPDAATFDAFRKGLADLGYIDGQNIRIEYRLAAWDYSRLPAMAGELVRLPVDVIFTDTQKSALIAHEATRTIPIVGATLGADPVAAGLAASFAHPGGNVTGFTGFGIELSYRDGFAAAHAGTRGRRKLLPVAAWHYQIGDDNLHGIAVLVQRRHAQLDQPLLGTRL
jgi:hypothetical protein